MSTRTALRSDPRAIVLNEDCPKTLSFTVVVPTVTDEVPPDRPAEVQAHDSLALGRSAGLTGADIDLSAGMVAR